MAVYHNSKQTEAGRFLEARARNGEGALEFTYIKTGSGIYTETEKELLRSAEGLKETRQAFAFSGISLEDDGCLLLESVINNQNLEEGYHFTEVGIFAKLAGTDEPGILYCIGLIDNPDFIPAQTIGKVYEILLRSLIKCYDAEHVTIQYNNTTYATARDLLEHKLNKKNPHGVTPDIIGALAINGDASDTTVDFTLAQTREPLESGTALKTLMGQTAKWLADLKTVAFSGSYTDLDITPTPADIGALGTSGGEMTGELVPSGGIAHVGRDGYIAYPDDGYIDMDGEVTGSLIVTLPITSSIPTMVKFTINVFNYETIESVSYLVSGHVWNGLWYHCTAVCVGNAAGKLSNLTVRFGMKDGRPVIMIGENTTVWNFPIVKIHDILIGFGNLEYSRWCKGWSITIGSISSYTVQGTLNNPHVGYGCVASSCTGNAATATTAANANALAGLPAQRSQGANTIPTRDAQGYTWLNYINSDTGNDENPTISQIIVTNGSDNFFRKASLAHLKAQMGLDAVNNTADSAKSVAYAASAGSAVNDSAGRNIAGTYLPLSGGTMSGNIAWPSGCYISDRNFNDAFAISGNHGNYIMFVDWAAKTPFLGPTWVEDNVGRVDLGRYQYPWKSVYANTFESTSLIKVGSSNISDKTFKLYGDTGPIIKCAYVNDMYISLPYYNTQNAIRFNAYNGNFYMVPEIDNYTYLGSGDRRYAQIYAVNGAIQTSDKREKHDISYIGSDSDYDTFMSDEQLCALIMGILPVVYRRNNGESRRPHHGLISQDFEELMHKIGLADHAGFIKSPKTRDVEVEDKNGEKRINQEIIEGEYTYGFRYEELITDIIRFCQLQQKQLESQAEELRELRTGLQAMEARIKALEA